MISISDLESKIRELKKSAVEKDLYNKARIILDEFGEPVRTFFSGGRKKYVWKKDVLLVIEEREGNCYERALDKQLIIKANEQIVFIGHNNWRMNWKKFDEDDVLKYVPHYTWENLIDDLYKEAQNEKIRKRNSEDTALQEKKNKRVLKEAYEFGLLPDNR